MALLSRQFLTDIGIELDDQSYALLSDHFETTLQERVIQEIVTELTPEQATKLTELQAKDDQELHQWLTDNVPDLSDIVSDEIDILLGEIAENSDQF